MHYGLSRIVVTFRLVNNYILVTLYAKGLLRL